jgi:CheY-like chemotaxis protein
MGGQLRLVSSEPGRGSIFELAIDIDLDVGKQTGASPLELPAPLAEAGGETRGLDGVSVLLVEDAEDIQSFLRTVLGRAGAHLQIATDGRSGVETALSAPFDIVLMDLQMPVMDGYAAARALRSAGFTPPILALTAHSTKKELDGALGAGCSGYVTKPIRKERLLGAIAASLCQTPSAALPSLL